MMQKNISVNSLKGAQKNMLSYSTVLVLINGLFLLLGACLYLFAQRNGLDIKGDDLFPHIALKSGLGGLLAVLFVIGLISALFPSADGALTSLTSAYCIDIIGINRNNNHSEAQKKRTRLTVHLLFTVLFFVCTMVFKWIDNRSIIDVILKLAGYTYGPLLGLFIFGVFTKRVIDDRKVLPIAIIAPIIMLIIDLINNADFYIKKLALSPSTAATLEGMQKIFGGYKIGLELLLMNGLLTFGLLMLFSNKSK
jgi:Na+/proline symporter